MESEDILVLLLARSLYRIRGDGDRILWGIDPMKSQRIRDVRSGPDGLLYLLTDENPGAVLKVEPAS